jgi:hypothetical protein
MRALLTACALAIAACHSDAGAASCPAPPTALTYDAGWGCEPLQKPVEQCQVSSGATLLPDGGVANGTESCTAYTCAPGEYALECHQLAFLPDAGLTEPDSVRPPASLGCTFGPDWPSGFVPQPGFLLVQPFCCPCR